MTNTELREKISLILDSVAESEKLEKIYSQISQSLGLGKSSKPISNTIAPVSEYKLAKIAYESFLNALRLHFDSQLLFNNNSFPSAFQLSVLSLEEFSKSDWVDHYNFYRSRNDGIPKNNIEEYLKSEQSWLKLLYTHSNKQEWFVVRTLWLFNVSPKFAALVSSGELDLRKQKSTYVGLERTKKSINTRSRISTPFQVTERDAKQMISIVNDYLKYLCKGAIEESLCFDIIEIKDLFNEEMEKDLKKWKYSSGIFSRKWNKVWQAKKSNPRE